MICKDLKNEINILFQKLQKKKKTYNFPWVAHFILLRNYFASILKRFRFWIIHNYVTSFLQKYFWLKRHFIIFRELPSYITPKLFCFHFEEFLVLNNNFIFTKIFLTLNTFPKKKQVLFSVSCHLILLRNNSTSILKRFWLWIITSFLQKWSYYFTKIFLTKTF
jgi:hypothetical protein